jgi:photosystem II stability/assembly factor-like uncharacterized protein
MTAKSFPVVPALLFAASACNGSGATHVGIDSGGVGSWTPAASGLPNGTVMTLAVDPHDPQTVYAGLVPGTVYKTTNGGVDWSRADNGINLPTLGFSPGIFSLAADRSDPTTVYAGDTGGGLWATSDGANSWSPFGSGGNDPGPRRVVVAVDPNDSRSIYVAGHFGLFTTTDGGTTWNALLQGPPKNISWITVDPHDKATAYSCDNGGAFRISGATMVTAINPPSLSASCGGVVDASGALYMGPWQSGSSTVSPATVLVTRDQGTTWSPASSGLPDPSDMSGLTFAADPFQAGVVYAIGSLVTDGGTAPSGVWRTGDGQSWQDVTDNLVASLSVIAIAPSDPGVVYLGTTDGRVFRRSGGRSPDSVDAAPDGGAHVRACVTLTVAFAGCDADRLAECEREYASLPPSAQAAIDADGACFRSLGTIAPPLNDTWPDTPGSCAPALTVENYWRHGACQGDNGQVAGAVTCGGTPVACSGLSDPAACQSQGGCRGDADGGACAGQATACAETLSVGIQCSSQMGCVDTSFPFCGQIGQPICFFTGTLS